MQIADTGNVLLVAIGKARPEKCAEVWEEIVRRNAEENGDYAYQNYLDNLREYYRLIAERDLVFACLLKLSCKVDRDTAKFLTSRGYVIRLGKMQKEDSEAYAKSLSAARSKMMNLNTKIEMKQKEMTNTTNLKGNQKTFESVMGSLIAMLGFEVSSDLTLARFNEYKKFIKEKYKKKQVA